MPLKSYLVIMLMATVVCWTVFAFIVLNIDPFATNRIGFGLFYISLFLALVGSSALVGFIARFVLLKKELVFRLVKDAFRQSFLFALLIIVALFLLSKELFTWLNLSFLVVGLSVLEMFLLGYERKSP